MLVDRLHGGHVVYAILVTVSGIDIAIGSMVGSRAGPWSSSARYLFRRVAVRVRPATARERPAVLADVVIAFGFGAWATAW